MVKGCQKRIIVLKGTNSSVFDEAYFVIKENSVPPDGTDMVKEALRIIEANTLPHEESKKTKKSFLWYLAGFISGCLLFGLILIFILIYYTNP